MRSCHVEFARGHAFQLHAKCRWVAIFAHKQSAIQFATLNIASKRPQSAQRELVHTCSVSVLELFLAAVTNLMNPHIACLACSYLVPIWMVPATNPGMLTTHLHRRRRDNCAVDQGETHSLFTVVRCRNDCASVVATPTLFSKGVVHQRNVAYNHVRALLCARSARSTVTEAYKRCRTANARRHISL